MGATPMQVSSCGTINFYTVLFQKTWENDLFSSDKHFSREQMATLPESYFISNKNILSEKETLRRPFRFSNSLKD